MLFYKTAAMLELWLTTRPAQTLPTVITDTMRTAYAEFCAQRDRVKGQISEGIVGADRLCFDLNVAKPGQNLSSVLCPSEDFRFMDANPRFNLFFEASHRLLDVLVGKR